MRFKLKVSFLFLIIFSTTPFAQKKSSFFTKSDTLHLKKRNTLILTESAFLGVTLLALNKIWYANRTRSNFHFIDDSNQWNQIDKMGHMTTSYQLGRVSMEALNWAGIQKKEQLIYGATLGFTFLTAVEVLDGFYKEWGASFSDIVANALGTGFLIGQELIWNEQRFLLKYSFHQTGYAKIKPNILGENFFEQTLQDYNGQTYWVSANVWSFAKESDFPKWLNIALGYGANGMLYGIDKESYRQFYLSLDIDLTKIKTKSKLLQSVFSFINFIKIPAPTLELNSKGKFKFHYLF